ncbi:MAG: FKBP-type peptidyl-prolyl cis-trans isomerase [Acidimicrobiia bacterium]
MRRLLVLVVAAGCLAAACGNDSQSVLPAGGSSASSSAPAPAPAALDAIEVTGLFGEKPTIDLPRPFTVATSARLVLIEGDGEIVEEGSKVTVDYFGVSGTDGVEVVSTYGARSEPLLLDPRQVLPGLVTGLVGVPVGSRVLVALAPADGPAAQGAGTSDGLQPTDTLVLVFDVKEIRRPLAKAVGTPVEPAPGLPGVEVAADGEPTITIPSSPAPAQLVTQPLIAGDGPEIEAGQTITAHYKGVLYATGAEFDSSWGGDGPRDFRIGTGNVIPGWDEAIVGKKVGSRLLLVVPADKAYGAAGQPAAGIGPTETLVFVVDLLDAA